MNTTPNTIEITRDFDGTYYSNVDGMPEYVAYSTLRCALRKRLGAAVPALRELNFSKLGRKSYAYFTAA